MQTKDYSEAIQKLVDAVLTSPAETSSQLRLALEARAANLSAAQREPFALPEELEDYIHKLALQAHEINDADLAALTAAGYSDDAIFEITISAALGTGLARLEKGLDLVKGLPA